MIDFLVKAVFPVKVSDPIERLAKHSLHLGTWHWLSKELDNVSLL